MRRTEAELCYRCDLVLAISEPEAEALRRMAPRTRVDMMPIGIEMDRYLPRATELPPIVLLPGSWEWPPNRDGGRCFVERGWASVRARVPAGRLRVVGKALPASLAEAARRAGAEAVGYVDDMAPEFARASVMVVPLWIGAGARVKIVEALAARLPVATTTLGAEGLGIEPGTHAVFADTPESLGEAVADLLRQPERGRALAEAGVYRGATSRFILRCAPARTLYLFDTFEGFPLADREAANLGDKRFRDTSEAAVRRALGGSPQVVIRAGRFPETLTGLEGERFAVVLLDLDVFNPTLAGLEFFYPRLARGGYLFVHDFNSPESISACRRAVTQFMADKPEQTVELPATWGSAVIRKS